MRILSFTRRCIKEILRDPLSYIFCLGFPLIMLILMTIIDQSIPAEAGKTVFHIENLTPGVAVFGQMFVMLFTALTVTSDRAGAFLMRLYATPMTAFDFTAGYMLPMLIIALIQGVITFAAGFIISLILGSAMNVGGILVCLVTLIPSALMFIGIGLTFGTLFNEKSAPGLCSVIISLGSFIGGIWFDAEETGGVLLTISKCTPFYYCTKSARAALVLDFSAERYFIPLAVVWASAIVMILIGKTVFQKRMTA
ncbi:MAG: ABC transporter permease [Ruminococcus sp.]|nr:ABC transporter permease [Ruminococcus sp.]